MRIIADSSSNVTRIEGVDFFSIPVTIQLGDKSYIDTPALHVPDLLQDMEAYSGPAGTACLSIVDWLDAFGDDDEIFVVTVTGTLSGCYNTAVIAAREYMEEHPDRHVEVLDSLSAGPQSALLAEHFADLVKSGIPFREACVQIREYHKLTRLVFMFFSLDNIARNGRISPALARLVSKLHITILGKGSTDGKLEPQNKCRGRVRGMEQLWKNMKACGYDGGKALIHLTENIETASELRNMILTEYPDSNVQIGENRGICAFYSERGGVLIGFEINPTKRK